MLAFCFSFTLYEDLGMADITLPHTFSDGTLTDAQQIEENIYRPNVTPPTSLSVINGRLDDENRESGWDIDRSHIQRGALSGGQTVGSTTNHHYFSQNFPGWSTAGANDTDDRYLMIPGAGQSFYLPFAPSLVVFTWSIFHAFPDNTRFPGAVHTANTEGFIRFFLNGTRVTDRIAPSLTTRQEGEWEYSRHWAGHFFWSGVSLTKGWHSASLGIAISADLANVRVKRLDYVYFR